jgi:hypothetical protein
MKIIAFTKHNPKHRATVLNWPEEDSFRYSIEKDKTLVALADGISRDPVGMPELPDYKKFTGKINYPIPSPAKKAAEIFCESFVKKSKKTKPSIKSVKESAIYANKKIKQLNKNVKVDYLENDFAACVASFGIISGSTLYHGFATDCGVCVFDKEGKLKFKTKNEGPNPQIEKEVAKSPEEYGASWREPQRRARTRRWYRNNPKEPLSYGAFTGEKEAINFVRTGEIKLSQGDFVIFFSDGFTPLILSENFNVAKLFPNLEDHFEKNSNKIDGSEGTLVALQL